MERCRVFVIIAGAFAALTVQTGADGKAPLGYYRFPALHDDTLVFTAEGDLWRVEARGGAAERLTTHPSEESRASIAPDGATIAFSASYEGPTEVPVPPAPKYPIKRIS